MTRKKKKVVSIIDKYADVIVNSPSWGHFHERVFVSWFTIGIPFHREVSQGIENSDDYHKKSVRILHAPSQPEAKGTVEIRRVIEALKLKGHTIEFSEIFGKSHSVVLEELTSCDFIVDQLYASYPLSGFATEAAFNGKPAVVGSYYSKYIIQDIPVDRIPPSYYCHPDEIEQAIEKMIVDKNYRLELGRKAQAFVKTHWSLKRVAERYLRLIEGNIPQEWLYDPKQIRYLQGGCISEVRARELVRLVIEQGGKEALQLSDKPNLEHMFLEFARCDKS